MPVSSGIDLLKRVRADHRFKSLPFVLVTAENELELVTEARDSGVDEYLIKPFNPEALKTKLEEVFKKRYAA